MQRVVHLPTNTCPVGSQQLTSAQTRLGSLQSLSNLHSLTCGQLSKSALRAHACSPVSCTVTHTQRAVASQNAVWSASQTVLPATHFSVVQPTTGSHVSSSRQHCALRQSSCSAGQLQIFSSAASQRQTSSPLQTGSPG